MKNKLNLSAVFWWLVSAAIMVTIFVFSSQNGSQSDATSGGTIRFFAELFYPGFKNLSEENQLLIVEPFQFIVRKAAHFSVFALLGLSFYKSAKHTFRNTSLKFKLLVSSALSLIYAVSDEIHQIFVPGRAGRLTDVLIDFVGSVCGVTVVVLLEKCLFSDKPRFKKAKKKDIKRITEIYNEIHTAIEQGRATAGWVRGIYPTEDTVKNAVAVGDMYIEKVGRNIVAAARINQIQDSAYKKVNWKYNAPADEVMLIHTLGVSTKHAGHSYGKSFIDFFESFALKNNCPYLRLDTNEKNSVARRLYSKLGYREAGVVPTKFNGIDGVNLVCLEKHL